MFTGIIEVMGTVQELLRSAAGGRTWIRPDGGVGDLRIGESIAVDGACLTAVGIEGDRFAADLSAETIARTTLGDLRAGDRVNLERPLRLGDRLGGHLVTGHVDGVGRVRERIRQGDGHWFRFAYPPPLAPLLVPKGSVAVDGISLTVADLDEATFAVAVIPHTYERTTLGRKGVGDPMNLEADLLGKYVSHLLRTPGYPPGVTGSGRLTREFLEQHGYA